jgi:hypothetical protein
VTQPVSENVIHVSAQRFKLRAWIRTRLWAQVIAGMILGFSLGLFLNESSGWIGTDRVELIGLWLALPGQVFLGLIAMVLVPLIFSSIVGGLNGAGSSQALRLVGLRLAGFVIVTTTFATGIGVVLAEWLQPGAAIRTLRGGLIGSRDESAAADIIVGPELPRADIPDSGPAATVAAKPGTSGGVASRVFRTFGQATAAPWWLLSAA